MAGKRDLQVVAVGEDTEDLRNIARELSALDISIEDEELLQTELRSPYEPFGPDDSNSSITGINTISLANGTDIPGPWVSGDTDTRNRCRFLADCATGSVGDSRRDRHHSWRRSNLPALRTVPCRPR